mmetsp:Transcript_44064/g.113978  ORF Transcript_44064/g.113978 Transcript_44064/m.113978 type:complete len:508 (-) Transcript_44064:427-1950(-)
MPVHVVHRNRERRGRRARRSRGRADLAARLGAEHQLRRHAACRDAEARIEALQDLHAPLQRREALGQRQRQAAAKVDLQMQQNHLVERPVRKALQRVPLVAAHVDAEDRASLADRGELRRQAWAVAAEAGLPALEERLGPHRRCRPACGRSLQTAVQRQGQLVLACEVAEDARQGLLRGRRAEEDGRGLRLLALLPHRLFEDAAAPAQGLRGRRIGLPLPPAAALLGADADAQRGREARGGLGGGCLLVEQLQGRGPLALRIQQGARVELANHGGPVEQLLPAHLRHPDVGVEEVVRDAVHRPVLLSLLPILLGLFQPVLLVEDHAGLPRHEGLVLLEAEGLDVLVRLATLHQLLGHHVRDALAQLGPGDVALHLRVVQAADLFELHLARFTMLREGLLLGLPHRLVDLAALLAPHEVGAEGAVRLTGLPFHLIGDQVIAVEPHDYVSEVPADQEVSVHVDAAVVVEQGVSDHVGLGGVIRQPQILLWHVRDPRLDVRVVDQDWPIA